MHFKKLTTLDNACSKRSEAANTSEIRHLTRHCKIMDTWATAKKAKGVSPLSLSTLFRTLMLQINYNLIFYLHIILVC